MIGTDYALQKEEENLEIQKTAGDKVKFKREYKT